MIISAKTKTILRLIHKYVGFIFSIFILILTVTGIISYPETFKLNDTYASNSFMLKKYNMLSIEDVKKLGRSTDEIILIDKSLYYKNTFIEKFEQGIVNAFYNKKGSYLIILSKEKIYFFFLNNMTDDTEVIDIKKARLMKKYWELEKTVKKTLLYKLKVTFIQSLTQE